MIHVAGEHSTANGFGIDDLMAQQRTWVLNKLTLEYDAEVVVSLPIEVTTGVLSRSTMSTERLLLVEQAGHTVVRGTSRWVALDLVSRRPVPLDTLFPPDLPIAELPDGWRFPPVPRRLGVEDTLPVSADGYDHLIRYSDLDINGHMNTASWVRIAEDAISIERWTHGRLRRAHFAFTREGYRGETATVEHTEYPTTDLCVVYVGEEEAFRLLLEWEP